MLADPSLPGEPWQTSEGHLEDFRDIVWAPGRYLLSGGNPYDPVPYLAANPWALQFSPYPPAWLLLGVLLAPMPFLVAAVAFLALSLAAAVVMLRVICTWALPRFADVAVPAGLLWINLWYPGRGAMASLGSVLAVLGVALVLRSVTRTNGPRAAVAEPDTRSGRAGIDVACAVGVALAAIKPHFGLLVVVVAAVGGRMREVWRGLLGLIIACVPVFIVVSVAAGGPLAFLQSVLRNVEYVNGPNTIGGLGSPFQRRLDLLGVLARHGLTDPPLWLVIGVPVAALIVTLVVVRLTRNPFWVSAVVCPAVLIGFFHPWYDALLMIVPLAIGIGMAIRGELTAIAGRLALTSCALVVIHLHTVSTFLIPGLTVLGADTIDLLLVAATLFFAVWGCLLEARRRRSRPSEEPPERQQRPGTAGRTDSTTTVVDQERVGEARDKR